YTQANRPIEVFTQLGADVLLLVGFRGYEAISQLFKFDLEMLAEDRKKVKFDQLLGQKVTVRLALPDDKNRYFNGICSRVSQGTRDETFTHFYMEVVPQFWLLTRRAQSRIFQHITVPDILKKVLQGVDVKYELQGTFYQRDFCVQYRESDFNFACRLMEEEGIYYFFKHEEGSHHMVVANTPQSHSDVEHGNTIIYDEISGGNRQEDRIYGWEKVQELRSGKYTLWDHSFELPHKHLESDKTIQESVAIGEVTHKLKVGQNERLEIYDYPGAYAQRFDGVDKGGGEQPSDVQHIFEDNKRTVGIRMQQEALPSIVINGEGTCGQFSSGHKFTLKRHFDADGEYVLTAISHSAALASDNYRSDGTGAFTYYNQFSCIPAVLPFRPPQVTLKPTVHGSQTAVVVGPAGEEIAPDKYGRVKVQFHWDRQGKSDLDSSCWIRVAQNQAGKHWGVIHIPRIGQEVVVDFLEGDPDQPIIVGSVYNAQEMPPYKLPDEKTKTVIFKSNTTKGGGGFNEIRIEDKKGKEQIFIHAERNKDIRVKADRYETVGGEYHLVIGKDQFETSKADKHLHIKGCQNEKVDQTLSVTVGVDEQKKVGQKYALEAGQEIHLKAGMTVVIEAGTQLTLKGPGGFINIEPSGITIQGTMVKINSGGAAGTGSGTHPTSPTDAKEADTAKPGEVSAPPPASPPPPVTDYSVGALALKQAAKSGAPGCDI
ncbi:MAG TPA: type VI secretion system tip protein TssI/VgrG, partial [Pyrinomonadaceae bacterium]|nr:type VI secretion system tip protein TssI/VgrG [Pyrinomonadaceae bacterium]